MEYISIRGKLYLVDNACIIALAKLYTLLSKFEDLIEYEFDPKTKLLSINAETQADTQVKTTIIELLRQLKTSASRVKLFQSQDEWMSAITLIGYPELSEHKVRVA